MLLHNVLPFSAFAHAFGQRYELPIPLTLFVFGGAGIVLLSFFLVIGRVVAKNSGAKANDQTHVRTWRPFATIISFLLFAVFTTAGLFGSQTVSENIVPTLFWLIVWIAVPLSCGLIGDWTQTLNPIANIAKLTNNDLLRKALLGRPEPLSWPVRLGWWPAVALYLIAACGELIFNLTTTLPAVTAGALLAYFITSCLLGLLFGRTWLARGEVFTVLFATWGRLGFYRFGSAGKRGFAGGLTTSFEPSISRMTFVLLILVSVAFDGLTATPFWNTFQHSLPSGLAVGTGTYLTLATAMFAGLAAVIWAVFMIFAEGVKRIGRYQVSRFTTLAGLLPSLLPISFGYLLAHNLQYIMVNSQLLFPLIGNPVGKEWWPFRLAYPFNDSFEPNIHIFSSAIYWYFSIAVVIAAHIFAVILAHRHLANNSKDAIVARRSEYPWVLAMIAYTMLSLWLLAQPLVKEKAVTGAIQQMQAKTTI